VSDQALGHASKFFNLDAWEDIRLPFILSPKASRKEKEAGLQESDDKERSGNNLASKLRPEPRKNPHPTVKPLKLMSYLITMGSREGDIVLDPFCGTGTTCIASMMLKRDYLGVEISKEYNKIALKRLEYFKRKKAA
jgi:site-specific DNA-methyltransferase (adenine-specific)